MKNNGGPAFPHDRKYTLGELQAGYGKGGGVVHETGISLREFIAIASLIGRRANPNIDQRSLNAKECYADADAMIAER